MSNQKHGRNWMQTSCEITPPSGSALWDAVARMRVDGSAKLRAIAGFVSEDPIEFIRMTSRDICARLGTSEPTLIRFCHALGYTGLADFRIELALALAGQAPSMMTHPDASDRRLSNTGAKRRIARAALPLLAEDRSILIDNGSTVEILAEELSLDDGIPPLTAMTTGLLVAQNLMRGDRHKVMLTGGMIRASTCSLMGRLAESSLNGMSFDSFIMSADTIDPEGGLSTYSEDEAHITRAMAETAARVIVLADHTKFRRARLYRICGLQQISTLVTDKRPAEDICMALDQSGVRLIIAEPDSEQRGQT
ncbi:MAG: DeoR/GlpR family DNA-binding transcription regulator [Paracoccus sp. (in: a-proteobacteria)]